MLKSIISSLFIFCIACSSDKKIEQEHNPKKMNLTQNIPTDSEIKITTIFKAFDTNVEVLFTGTQEPLSTIQKKNFDNFVLKQDLLTPEILQLKT